MNLNLQITKLSLFKIISIVLQIIYVILDFLVKQQPLLIILPNDLKSRSVSLEITFSLALKK